MSGKFPPDTYLRLSQVTTADQGGTAADKAVELGHSLVMLTAASRKT